MMKLGQVQNSIFIMITVNCSDSDYHYQRLSQNKKMLQNQLMTRRILDFKECLLSLLSNLKIQMVAFHFDCSTHHILSA